MEAEEKPVSRRPLKSRSSAWARALAGALCRWGVAPNQISAASVVFAAGAGVAFVVFGEQLRSGFDVAARWLLVGAAVGIQLRLVCNLMDGMVAVEGKRRSATGELWNEVPDRFADVFILVGAGLGAGVPWLGVAAAVGALLTAYIRALGVGLTSKQDFSGPMAKPQRMAAMTVAALAGAVFLDAAGTILEVFLWVVAIGTATTFARRMILLAVRLDKGGGG